MGTPPSATVTMDFSGDSITYAQKRISSTTGFRYLIVGRHRGVNIAAETNGGGESNKAADIDADSCIGDDSGLGTEGEGGLNAWGSNVIGADVTESGVDTNGKEVGLIQMTRRMGLILMTKRYVDVELKFTIGNMSFNEDDGYTSSYSLQSRCICDGECVTKAFRFNLKIDIYDPKFKIAMVFKDATEFQDPVRVHAVLWQKDINSFKIDHKRVRARSQYYRIRKKINDMLNGDFKDRYYVRHMYNNFKKDHPRQTLKDRIWNIAKALNVNQCKCLMEKVKEIYEGTHKWTTDVLPRHWSRSQFRTSPKCDIFLNNMCESFNAAIPEARSKPLLAIMESLRIYLMKRMQSKKDDISRWNVQVCPKILD
ncbi:hypothetical protein BUALT_Bualt12G0108300 [Buddleja alternifolia]|uniref:Uncharacterized protein n=1 Tax=Buddleja alternifolia TaxID=168488 RepID=A0AAV6X0R5_9LAMI|nr:hypothetical protein BUALT_Bualt12G0108300 [Buddleja alternifolia]